MNSYEDTVCPNMYDKDYSLSCQDYQIKAATELTTGLCGQKYITLKDLQPAKCHVGGSKLAAPQKEIVLL